MAATGSTIALFSLSLNDDFSLSFDLSLWAVLAIVIFCAAIFLVRWWLGWRLPNFQLDAAEMGIGNHKLSFKPNLRDQEIAYKIWVELSTRKIGLPIDLEHDVISEIYDSWYNFFSITRELIKDIPVNKAKNNSTRKITALSIDVLNKGLRPHLTAWQARFRHWYDRQLAQAGDDIDPQTLQAKYPKFDELKKDLLNVNERLIRYREKMHELVLGLPTADGV